MNIKYSLAVIVICALCTFFERAFPFIVFKNREVPKVVKYLGTVLPMAIITTLIFYCLRGIRISEAGSAMAQLLSVVVTAVLHLWKRNSLLSILGGTICCMLLTQFVFI